MMMMPSVKALLALCLIGIAAGDECVDVNHKFDNPGELTCECVPKDDPCLKDEVCELEPRCKDFSQPCVPYSVQACRDVIQKLNARNGGPPIKQGKFGDGGYTFAGPWDVKGCHVYGPGPYEGMVYYGRNGSEEQMKAEPQTDGEGNEMYRPIGYDCVFEGKDRLNERARCNSMKKRSCQRSTCCEWSKTDRACYEVKSDTCGAIESLLPTKDSCTEFFPRRACLAESGCKWSKQTSTCSEAEANWADKCTSYTNRRICMNAGCRWRHRLGECEVPL